MGSYTTLTDVGSRMKARRNRERSAHRREADRAHAPFACPSCYDTSIVAMDCPGCAEPMVRLDQAIVLPVEARTRAWAGWPFVWVALLAAGPIVPWAIAHSTVDARSPRIPGPHDDPTSMLAMGIVVGVLMLLVTLLALRARHRSRAPGRRAQKAAAKLREQDIELAAALGDHQRARVRGIARVRRSAHGCELFVEDESGRVRVEVDESLSVYGPSGPLRAITDGDEVEVGGMLMPELGDAEGYRDRKATRAFASGATVLVD